MKWISILFMAVVLLNGCLDRREQVKVDPARIYFNYRISGEEQNPDVTVNIRFHVGSGSGRTVRINKPGRVELDYELIPSDSTQFTGVYYEIQKPLDAFTGDHIISYFDENGMLYSEEFLFQPFELEPIPDTIIRGDIIINVSGLDSGNIRVVLTDTSFESTDFNEVLAIKNGQIIVTNRQLGSLVDGPIFLELIHEYERPITRGSRRGGILTTMYGLKRQFVLQGFR